MKRITGSIRTALLPLMGASFLLSTMSAAPLVSIGENAALYFIGESTARYNSNIFNTSTNEESDLMLILSPGLELTYGRGDASLANMQLTYREDFYLYEDNNDLDTNLSNLFFRGSYDASKWNLNAAANWQEIESNQNLAGGAGNTLLSRDTYGGSVSGEYIFTPKTRADAQISYNRTEYQNLQNFFNDRSRYALPVNLYYEYSPKLFIGPGYRIAYTDVEPDGLGTGDNEYIDHFVSLALKGEFTAKLTGRANIGWQYRGKDVGDDTSELSITSALDYLYSPKLTFTGSVDRDFDTAGDGNSVLSTGFNLSARYAFTPRINFGANTGYQMDEWQTGREDDTYRLGLSAGYTPNDYLTFSASYNFEKVESNRVNEDYDSHIIGIKAALRY